MILQSLVAFANREHLLSDTGFVSMPVHWLVDIDQEGRVLGVISTEATDESTKKPRYANFLIPKRRTRTVGVVPDLLVDKSDYLFGFNAKFKPGDSPQKLEKNQARLVQAHDALMKEMESIVAETASSAARAQWQSLRWIANHPHDFAAIWRSGEHATAVQHAGGDWLQVPKSWKGNHLFAFRCGDRTIVADEAVKSWVANQVAAPPAGQADLDCCLVSGCWCVPVQNHDQFDLPGDTGRLPLISFNAPSSEHYERSGNRNAPVSSEAANAVFMALRRLLGLGDFRQKPLRHLRLTGNTTVLFWADTGASAYDATDDLFMHCLFGGEEGDIGQIPLRYKAPYSGGRPPLLEETQTLFSLVLTREKSRVVLRTAELTTIGSVAWAVLQFFDDLAIAGSGKDPDQAYRGLRHLLRAVMPYRSGQQGADDPPNDLANRLYACAIDAGKPLPPELLAMLLRRFRAHDKAGFSRSRMALLKAVLNRTFLRPQNHKELSMSLDPSYPEPAYHLGRLFAVLEKIQAEATNPQHTIVDGYLGAAFAAPATVFPRLLKLSHHHLAKIGGDRPGRKVNLARLIDAIYAHIPPELPSHLPLLKQGLFMAGYHHQRVDLWTAKTDKSNDPKGETHD